MMALGIQKVLLEEGAQEHPGSARILKCLSSVPVERVSIDPSNAGICSGNMDKRTLHLVRFKGEFLKPCPGTKNYICCGYRILHIGTNCPLDCTYCILQAYVNQPSLRVFVNLNDALCGIGSVLDASQDKIFRVGTGEFTDSLALDPITGWTSILLPFFSRKRNAVLELKTKTDRIDGLLSSPYRDRIIVSWSLNSPEIIRKEERGAPNIERRLTAARKCQREGYTLGFHFDPLILHPDWKEGYMRTVEVLDKYIDPKGIIWISLGCLRFMPILKSIIRFRHGKTHVLKGEFVQGLDGKMRYFKPFRMQMYGYMGKILRDWHDDLAIYLCMESDDVWHRGLGWSPGDSSGLSYFLDQRVVRFFAR
jgi:spore photoproduct lyase